MTLNSFDSRSTLTVLGRPYAIHRLDALAKCGHDISRLRPSLRVRVLTMLALITLVLKVSVEGRLREVKKPAEPEA